MPALKLTGTASTIAGRAFFGSQDGSASVALFHYPKGIVTDGTNLYIVDTWNHTIRQMVISTGVVSTLAGSAGFEGSADGKGTDARFNQPTDVTTDGANLYVTDNANHTIRKVVISTGEVSTLAGSAGQLGSINGARSAARFSYPGAIATDGTNLFLVEGFRYSIRKVVISTGTVTTLAGSASTSGSHDGFGTSARFGSLNGLTVNQGNLYVTDSGNHTIRKVLIATGAVSTISLTYGAGDPYVSSGKQRFSGPGNVTNDGANLYVLDNNTICKVVIATGEVTTIAGFAGSAGSKDGVGSAALFNGLTGIATDGTNLFVTDNANNEIRKVVIASGIVTTIVGNTNTQGSLDAIGSAARFHNPENITTDGENLYVADCYNSTIRKIVIATGEVVTIAGSTGSIGSNDGVGSAARFYYPGGITTDGVNIYLADTSNNTIRQVVIANGLVTTLAGRAGLSGTTDGFGSEAQFNHPSGITTDGTNLFLADMYSDTIRKIEIDTGKVTTLAGSAENAGSIDGVGSTARFNYPYGITTDGLNLYVADTSNHTIRQVVVVTGEVTTLVGTAGLDGANDGVGPAVRFNYPHGITTDGTNIYVADTQNHAIRQVVVATGEVTTLAGYAGVEGANDGSKAAARFQYPYGITTNGTKLFVTDTFNNTIRLIN